jgi:hypothetical protein
MRSLLATTTCRPVCSRSIKPTCSATIVSMKLRVDPESNNAMSENPLMATETYIVRPERGWIPVSVCKDMVRSASIGAAVHSSTITSIMKSCLHCSLWS